MRRWTLALCAILLLTGCGAADRTGEHSSSAAVSHSVSVPAWMEEDYEPTGKYDFRVPDGTQVEYIMAVPDFLNPEQQYRYAAAMEAYRAFVVRPGFQPDASCTRPTDLPYSYVRETAFADAADWADYLRSLFDYDLFLRLHGAYVPVECASSDGPALVGQSLYAEFEGDLYVLDAAPAGDFPYPTRFALTSRNEDEILFETCYDDSTSCTLCLTNTPEGWRFSQFSTPYDGQYTVLNP